MIANVSNAITTSIPAWRAWKWGGPWSSTYIWITIPKNREISGIARRYGPALVRELLTSRLPELLVAALESGPVGQVDSAAWEMDHLPIDLL